MKYYKTNIPNTPYDIETFFFSEILIFCISYNNDFYSSHSMLLEKKRKYKRHTL